MLAKQEEEQEEQEHNVSSVDDDPLIPQGPYPPIAQWRYNNFDTSPQGCISHFAPTKKTAMVGKQRDIRNALNEITMAKDEAAGSYMQSSIVVSLPSQQKR